jgi:hypothetical protein
LVFSYNQFNLDEFVGKIVPRGDGCILREMECFSATVCMRVKLKPIASVGEPPACIADGYRRSERPPERKREVSNQAEDRERDPEYFSLHTSILDPSAPIASHRQCQVFQIQMLRVPVIPMTRERLRHDP